MDYKNIAASLMMPRLQIDKFKEYEDYRFYIKKLINLGVSSFCLFGRLNLSDVRNTISELNNHAERELLYSADLEYGLKMRFNEGTAFPHAMAQGKTKDYKLTFLISQLIAQEAKNLGIHWNFAPVSDINSNPDNPIINIRSFGEDAELVGLHSAAYIKGLHEVGMLSCAKHFPGHGETSVDSHLELPTIEFDIERLREIEFKPFIKSIENGVDSIMVGHLSVPALGTKQYPASLSKSVIDILRNELKFEGLVIPDALDMHAVADSFDSTLAAELALQAGNDLLLLPEDVEMAIEGVENLIKKDAQLLRQAENSIEKINRKFSWVKNKNLPNNINFNEDYYLKNEKFSLQVARKAIELDIKEVLIPLDTESQIAAFAFLQRDEDVMQASHFFNFMQQALEYNFDFAYINENIEEKDLIGLREGIEDAEVIIFAYFYKSIAYHGSIGITDKLYSITQRMAMGKPIINIFFGNPYISENLPAELTIKTFSDTLSSMAAATMVLSGKELIDEDKMPSMN